jgi:hypothetical protein
MTALEFILKYICQTDKKGFLKLISEKAFNQLADTPEMENLTCLELLDKFHRPSPYS